MELQDGSGGAVRTTFFVLLSVFLSQTTWAIEPTTIYESATLGPTGQVEGWGLVTMQFIGSRFYVDREVEVTAIGGHLVQWETGDLFGAIVELSSSSDLLNGSPFVAYEVVASTVFDPGYPSSDFRTPLSVTLTPDHYALIFGTDALGSSGGEGAMPYMGQSNYPGSSYIVWNGVGWFDTEPSPPPRFLVEGIASYCDAGGYCGWEYIKDVTVGTINNTNTGCQDYSDYTSLSTTMQIGNSYPITVVNGDPYPEDQCGIWIDWNQDAYFDGPDETIAVTGSPGGGPYTATITVPETAAPGDTRMRIRIVYGIYLEQCGYETSGEVEDYTITVVSGVTQQIEGTKFHDLNNNSIHDGGEAGLEGWRIYIDLDEDGEFDSGEPNALTNSSGDYVISAPEPGTYTVAEVGQSGWRQTAPVHLPESISVSDSQDLVFDWKRDLLYISRENGTVMRYDLSTQGLLSAYTVGTELNRMDITVDGDTLYVSEDQADGVEGLGYLHKVRLSDGAVTDISYELDFGEWGSWDVSIGCCGKGLMTTTYEGSGHVPLRELQVSTDTLAVRTDLPGYYYEVNQDTRIFRSADRTLLFLAEGNSSVGPVFTYDAVMDTFGAYDEIYHYAYHIPIAVNRDGSLIALKPYNCPIRILNRSLSVVKLLNTGDGGLVFDTVRDILYVVDSDSDEIVALETRCWNELFRIDVGQNISDYDSLFNRGHMAVSDDGRFLALSTGSAVLVFQIDMKHEVTVGAGETVVDIDFGNQVNFVGDFDGDLDVDWVDVDALCEAWLTDEACVDIWPAGGDGIVNIYDFAAATENWLVGVNP